MRFCMDETGVKNRHLITFKEFTLDDFQNLRDETRYNERFRHVTRTVEYELKETVKKEIQDFVKSDFWDKDFYLFHGEEVFKICVFLKETVSFRGCKTDESMERKIQKSLDEMKGEKITDKINSFVNKKLKGINDSFANTIDRHNVKTIQTVKDSFLCGGYNEAIDKELHHEKHLERIDELDKEIKRLREERNTLYKKIFYNRVNFFKTAYLENSKNPNDDMIRMIDNLEETLFENINIFL